VSRRLAAIFVSALLGSGVVAACGSDDSGGGGGGGGNTSSGGGGEAPKIEGAKVIDPASMNSAKGDVTLCMGKDTSGDKTALVKQFNKANPASRPSCSSSRPRPTSSARRSSSARRRSRASATSSTPT